MGQNSAIEWTTHTFNPWEICTPVSAGCANCYASALHKRFHGQSYKAGIPRRRTSEANWKKPILWNRQAEKTGTRPRVFCASMADVFDAEAPDEWRDELFALIARTPNLDWLILTKRPENILSQMWGMENQASGDFWHWIFDWLGGNPPRNVWIGTSVENQDAANKRIPELLKVPAAVRFLSCEPLLGPVDLEPYLFAETYSIEKPTDRTKYVGGPDTMKFARLRDSISWVIAGGESGPNARPCHPEWARGLRDQCAAAGVPYFWKQWGEYLPFEESWHPDSEFSDVAWKRVGKKAAGRLLDGVEHNDFPEVSYDS